MILEMIRLGFKFVLVTFMAAAGVSRLSHSNQESSAHTARSSIDVARYQNSWFVAMDMVDDQTGFLISREGFILRRFRLTLENPIGYAISRQSLLR
jgi:hypothetical protein